MTDQTIVRIGENSPEQVAFKLMEIIAIAEGKAIKTPSKTDRKWLLDTYAECLRTVREPQGRGSIERVERVIVDPYVAFDPNEVSQN